jgi:hypothetical protein
MVNSRKHFSKAFFIIYYTYISIYVFIRFDIYNANKFYNIAIPIIVLGYNICLKFVNFKKILENAFVKEDEKEDEKEEVNAD